MTATQDIVGVPEPREISKPVAAFYTIQSTHTLSPLSLWEQIAKGMIFSYPGLSVTYVVYYISTVINFNASRTHT